MARIRAPDLTHTDGELSRSGSTAPERVLVTGGAGFIGSHLVDRLRDDGSTVTVLDDLSTGRRENLARHDRGTPGFELAIGSVLDPTLVDDLVSRHDLVFHLAAAVGVRYIVQDPLKSLMTNVRGTENVLASAALHRRRVVLASSSEVYGKADRIPFREDDERVLGPTWVHRWSYSTAKALDEHLAFAYSERGLPIAVVRYFNSYGPRIDESGYGSVIARFASQALEGSPLTVHGDGLQTRCFTYVGDTVQGTLLAGRHPGAIGRVFNIGSTREVSILQLAELVRSCLRSTSPIELVPYEMHYPGRFQDTRRRVPDTTLARDVLGFEAVIPFEEGLDRTLTWCQEHYRAAGRSR